MYSKFFKRFFDILLSGLAMLILSPVLLVLIVLVAIFLGRPVLFKQVRPGYKNKLFCMQKFRTMTNAYDKEGNLLPDSERMTKFGRRLRSLSLDELPELWNIFTGKMSIVGPRPQLVKDLVFFDDEIAKRQSVRPGLTGLAQVSGRNNATWDERFECDLKYVQKITFWGDLKILFKTVGKVFSRSDVATDGMDTSEDYGDYLLRLGRIDQATYDEKVAKSKEMIKEFLG